MDFLTIDNLLTLAMLTLLQGVLGFDNAKAFTGSYKAWVEAGEEVTTG